MSFSLIQLAVAEVRVGALALGKAEVDKDAASMCGRVEEVGGLDVAMQDIMVVDGFEGCKEAVEVVSHVGYGEVAEVFSEVAVLKVG